MTVLCGKLLKPSNSICDSLSTGRSALRADQYLVSSGQPAHRRKIRGWLDAPAIAADIIACRIRGCEASSGEYNHCMARKISVSTMLICFLMGLTSGCGPSESAPDYKSVLPQDLKESKIPKEFHDGLLTGWGKSGIWIKCFDCSFLFFS